MTEMTTGECRALVSMMTGVSIDDIVAFALVTVVEGKPGCECGHPEAHRKSMVSASTDDSLLCAGILAQGLAQVVRIAAEEKFGGGT